VWRYFPSSLYVPPTTDEHTELCTSFGCATCLTNLTREANVALSTTSRIARRAEGTAHFPSKQIPVPYQCSYLLTTWLSFGYSVDKRTGYTRSGWNATSNNANWCQHWRWSRCRDRNACVVKSVAALRADATAVVPTEHKHKHEHNFIFMYGSGKDPINSSPYRA
jgi:hypothetical protein